MNRNLQFAALATLLLLAPLANAAGNRSNTPEYFYQPNIGVVALSLEAHEYLPQPTLSINTLGGTNLSSVALADTGYSLGFSYGFTDAWSIDAKIGTDNKTFDTTPVGLSDTQTKASGFDDYLLGISNITQMSGWNLHVGIHVGISPGKQLLPAVGSAGNNASGGTSLENYLGFSYLLGSGFFGAKLAYTTLMQRSSNFNTNGSLDFSTVGGNTTALSLFYELDAGAGFEFDANLVYDIIDPASSTYSDGSTSSVDAHNVYALGIGAENQITSGINFRVAYQIAFNPTYNVNGYQWGAFSQGQLGARLRVEF